MHEVNNVQTGRTTSHKSLSSRSVCASPRHEPLPPEAGNKQLTHWTSKTVFYVRMQEHNRTISSDKEKRKILKVKATSRHNTLLKKC
jgi:hypothetical protein